jgi:hypothetical protein
MAFLGGCGSAASVDHSLQLKEKDDPLLRLQGRIIEVQNGLDDLQETRAALVWFPSMPTARHHQATQDLGPPSLKDVLKLEVDIAQGPPLEAIEMGSAQAELIFYIDDGNKRLDVMQLGFLSPDRVVGRAPDSLIVWGPRTSSTPDQPRKPGNLARVCTREPPDYQVLCDTNRDDPETGGMQPIPIRFSKEEVLGSYTCAGFAGSREWSDTTPGLSAELRRQICTGCFATANSVSTDQRGCRFERTPNGWKACVDEPLLCGTTFCHIGTGAFVEGASDCK